MDGEALLGLLGTWGYVSFLVLLILTGVGCPVPEDLLLVAAGYLAFVGVFEWMLAWPLGVAGVVGSDILLYAAGRHLAWRSSRWCEPRWLSPERLQHGTNWFARLGDAVIVVARCVPGTRVIVFASAGMRGMPFGRFLWYDVLGAALWVPAMLYVGHRFGQRLGALDDVLALLTRGTAWVTLAISVLFLLWLRFGRDEAKW